jgi:hypothetical protein
MFTSVCLAALVVLLSVAAVCSAGSGTGASVAVSPTVINGYIAKLLPIIEKQLQNVPIPDINQKSDGFELSFTGMILSGAGLTNADVQVVASGIQTNVAGLSFKLAGNYDIKEDAIGHVTICSGGFSVNSASSSLSMVVTIGADASGVPQVTVPSVDLNIGDWDIKFCKALSVLVKLFHSVIDDAVKKAVQNAIPGAVQSAAAKVISKIPFDLKLSSVFGLDVHLSQNPVFIVGQSMAFPVRAQVYDPSTMQVSPYAPEIAVPSTVSSGQSITFYAASSVMQGAAWTYFSSGALTHTVQGSGFFKNFEAVLNVTSIPALEFTTEGVSVGVEAEVILQDVLFKDLAAALDLKFSTVGDVMTEQDANGTRVYFQIPTLDVSHMDIVIDIKHSAFHIDLSLLAPLLNDLLNSLLNAKVNPQLKHDAIPLPPLPEAQLTALVVTTQQGLAAVGATVIFQ